MARHMKDNIYKPQSDGVIESMKQFMTVLNDFVVKFGFAYMFIKNERKMVTYSTMIRVASAV